MTTLRPRPTPSGYHENVGELRGLTGLRIVAAAWVVFFHFHFTPLPGVAEVVALAGPLLTAGALGVDLFFVLSGFVIAYTYLDQLGPALRAESTARFVWARACRLWPAYALVFHLFGVWLAVRFFLGTGPQIAFQAVQPVLSVGEYLQQLVMVQLWDDPRFDGASWVGSTWSISAEWLAYLLFPVAALGFFRLRNLPAAVLGVLAVAAMSPTAWAYLTTGSPYFDWSWLVRILSGFGAGVLAYLAVRRLRGSATVPPVRVRAGASVVAAALPVLVAAGLLAGELLGPGRGGAVLVVFPLLVGALAVADRGPALVLSAPWAVYGGRISYCLYLVHIPMLELYWFALQRVDALGPHTWLAHLTGLAVVGSTFVVAAGLFRLVEEPARRRMRRLAPRLSGPERPRAAGSAVILDPRFDHVPGPAFAPVPGPGPDARRPAAVAAVPTRPVEVPVAAWDEVPTDRFAAVPPVRPPAHPAGRDPRPTGPGPVRPARRTRPAPSPFPRARRRPDPGSTGQPRSGRTAGAPSDGPARPADTAGGSTGISLFEPTVRPQPHVLAVDPVLSPLLAALVHAEGRRTFT